MRTTLGTYGHFLSTYSREALTDFRQRTLLEGVGFDLPTTSYLREYSRSNATGFQMLGKQIYDLSHGGEPGSSDTRRIATQFGGLVMVYLDIIDDQIDLPELDEEHRLDLLNAGAEVLTNGETGYDPASRDEELTLRYGQQLFEGYARFDEAGIFRGIVQELVRNGELQVTSRDMDEQLDLAARVGEGCTMIYSAANTVTEGSTDAKNDTAIRGIGAFAECMDHAYEISQDLAEGAPTYATLYIGTHGDTRKNRQVAKRHLLERAQAEYGKGRCALNASQTALYDFMGYALRARYLIRGNFSKATTGDAQPVAYAS